MSAPDVISHSHGARVDTRMHRPSVILADYDADDYCAEEGGRVREASAAADAPDLYAPSPLHIPRERAPTFGIWKALFGVIGLVLTIGLVAALLP